jgi:hypothetical protein
MALTIPPAADKLCRSDQGARTVTSTSSGTTFDKLRNRNGSLSLSKRPRWRNQCPFDKLRDRTSTSSGTTFRQAQESKWVVEPFETIRGQEPSLRQAQGPPFDKLRNRNGSLSLSKRSGGKNRPFDKLRDHLRQAQGPTFNQMGR